MQAFVFPGQGSQYSGMGRDFFDRFQEAREVFEEADECLGLPLSRLCFEGPDDQLTLTENTQPAVLTVSVAIWRTLQKQEIVPDFVAGHSLGEYSALVAAGSLAFRDAVRIVRLRGRSMQEAVPAGFGSMAAVLGLAGEMVRELCQEASEGEVLSPANLNSPDQIVIAGSAEAVSRASSLALEKGALRVVPLPVSAPFHCSLMEPARKRLAEVLADVSFGNLTVPLVNNVDAKLVHTGEAAREALLRQMVATVRWTDCVRTLKEEGAVSLVEVGPGKVLTGLTRRIDRSLKASSVGTVEQWNAYVHSF